ncbi:hypothetical protein AB0E08_05550 [Streptomyces sp. NPDC048281]|uniref:hypothetical protein n=1 Tax=Streptomyces sp. NPDC048281 TaxID=3154715 RepID=UPI003437B6DD
MIDDFQQGDLAQVESAVRNFTDAEVAVAEAQRRLEFAKQGVIEQVAHLSGNAVAVHDPALVGVLRHLYWQQRGISSKALADAAGLTINEMLAVIGPSPSGIPCSVCSTPLLRTSRSWTPGRYGPPVCPECEAQKREASSRQRRVKELRARFIGSAPVDASVGDWRAAATLVLAFPPLSQKVEPGSEADHKEGVWLGWENARKIRDQLVGAALSDDDQFQVPAAHAQLLIDTAFRMAGWDTARTRDLLDPITTESAHGLLTRLNVTLKAVVDAATQRVRSVYPDTYEPGEDDIQSLWGERPTWWAYLRHNP